MRVYVIAAYSTAPEVRTIHARLRAMGHEPTSSWAEEATGPEDLAALSDDECLAIWHRNAIDMGRASIVLVLADTPMREGHAEVARAMRDRRHDVAWVGRPTLSARTHDRVWYCADLDTALVALGGGA